MSDLAIEGLMSEGDTPAAPVEAPVAPVVSPPVQEPAAPVAQPEPEAPISAAPAAPVSPMVPLTAVLDTRDKLRATQAELAEYRRREAEELKRRETQAAEVPNMLDDPQGYHDWVQSQFSNLHKGFESKLSAELARQRISISTRIWTKELGAEKFKELHDFTATMPPNWVRHAEQQDDPYGFAMEEYEKRQKMERAKKLETELGGKDLATFLAEKENEWRAQNAPAPVDPNPVAPSPSQPRGPDGKFAPVPQAQRHEPVSLAHVAPSSGGNSKPNGGSTLLGLIPD